MSIIIIDDNMPAQNVSMSDEIYSLIRTMQDTNPGATFSGTLAHLVKLGWAHWSGCMGEGKE